MIGFMVVFEETFIIKVGSKWGDLPIDRWYYQSKRYCPVSVV